MIWPGKLSERVTMATEFEVGRVYRHRGTGRLMDIIGSVQTTGYQNPVLIGEQLCGIRPVGSEEGHADEWDEVSREEWNSAWDDPDGPQKRTGPDMTRRSEYLGRARPQDRDMPER